MSAEVSEPTTPSQAERLSYTHEIPQQRPIACLRCRERKVKCDRALPACMRCVKAGIPCVDAPKVEKSRVPELEKRIAELEDSLRKAENEKLTHHGEGHQDHQTTRSVISTTGQTGGYTVDSEYYVTTQANVSSLQPVLAQYTQQSSATIPATSVVHLYPASQSTGPSPSIGMEEPIAHEVGLISLVNSSEPKYLGPSSGISFAKLIYASSPQTQGLSNSAYKSPDNVGLRQSKTSKLVQRAVDLPSITDMLHFVDAYLRAYQPLYPFLDELKLETLVDNLCKLSMPSAVNKVSLERVSDVCNAYEELQLLCIFHLGAKLLEVRLSQDFASESYMLAALERQGKTNLHDSVAGVQVMLLLLLSSLHSPSGLNAWFLKSTLIASCVDLGLQRARKYTGRLKCEQRDLEVEAGIFWSVYSLERTLSVILGRPLTLRDEAIDVDFPGCHGADEVHMPAINADNNLETPSKRQRVSGFATPAVYSLRFDRLTAEIKLMLYRVAQSPSRFPWPQDIPQWTETALVACQNILEDSRSGMSGKRADVTLLLNLELKYHQCILLLYRPSPALPRPTALALKRCFDSACDTVRIMSELAKFGDLPYSWLNVHMAFVAGITILYSVWISPQIRSVTMLEVFIHHAEMCKELLSKLSTTWSVAATAGQKFKTLSNITKSNWDKGFSSDTSSQTQVRDVTAEVDAAESASHLQDPLLPGFELLPNGEIDWGTFDLDYNFADPLLDTLGPMSDLFDLNWIPDFT